MCPKARWFPIFPKRRLKKKIRDPLEIFRDIDDVISCRFIFLNLLIVWYLQNHDIKNVEFKMLPLSSHTSWNNVTLFTGIRIIMRVTFSGIYSYFRNAASPHPSDVFVIWHCLNLCIMLSLETISQASGTQSYIIRQVF